MTNLHSTIILSCIDYNFDELKILLVVVDTTAAPALYLVFFLLV